MGKLAIEDPVFSRNSGLMRDLENAITPQEIRKLERLGYIENAVSPHGETWRLSRKGKQARKALTEKSTFFDCLSDFFFRNVLRYRVSI